MNKTGSTVYKAFGKEIYIIAADLLYKADGELAAISHIYARNNEMFLKDVASVWTKLMNSDRFDGPAGNLCHL